MLDAKLIGVFKGFSEKTQRDWHSIEAIVRTTTGGSKVLKEFCTVEVYNVCCNLSSLSDVKLACGYTDSGKITICNAKVV